MSDTFELTLEPSASTFKDDLRWLSLFRIGVRRLYRQWLTSRVARSRRDSPILWQGTLVAETLKFHGLDHWTRVGAVAVALLRARLAAAPSEAQGFDLLEWEDAILNAAFFHDVARANETGDPEHGERGARIYEKLAERVDQAYGRPELIPLVAEAIRRHDSQPAVLPEANLILRCLATADRLDRPRFGETVDRRLLYPNLAVERWQRPSEALAYEDREEDANRGVPLADPDQQQRDEQIERRVVVPFVQLWGNCEGGPLPLGAYRQVRLVADRRDIQRMLAKETGDRAEAFRACDVAITSEDRVVVCHVGSGWASVDPRALPQRFSELSFSGGNRKRFGPSVANRLLYIWSPNEDPSPLACCRRLSFDDDASVVSDHEHQPVVRREDSVWHIREHAGAWGDFVITAAPSRADSARGQEPKAEDRKIRKPGATDSNSQGPAPRRSSVDHITRRPRMSKSRTEERLLSPDIVFEKSARGWGTLVTALQFRGFLVEEKEGILRLSDNVQWEDRPDFPAILAKSGLPPTCWMTEPGANVRGTPAERRPNVLVSKKNVDAWAEEDPNGLEQTVIAIINKNQRAPGFAPHRMAAQHWRAFRDRNHGYLIRALALDAGIAYFVKALNAIGAATWCSCAGHDEDNMHRDVRIDFSSAHWGAWAKAVVERLELSDDGWAWRDESHDANVLALLRIRQEDRNARYRSAIRAAGAMYENREALRKVRRNVIATFAKPRREPTWQELHACAEESLKVWMPKA